MRTVRLVCLTIVSLFLVLSFSIKSGAFSQPQDDATSSTPVLSLGADAPLCQDETCPLPVVNDQNQPVYAVVSPVGFHAVEPIEQAPRLDSLAGKRIALTGGSFMAATTHDELKRLIEEEFPTAKVYMFQDVGVGGPYSVFGQTAQTKAFQSRLKELGIDAVVSGNCGCGLCTVKESGSAIAAEYVGIPAVAIGAPTFIAQIRSTGVNRGVPALSTRKRNCGATRGKRCGLRSKTRSRVPSTRRKSTNTPRREDALSTTSFLRELTTRFRSSSSRTARRTGCRSSRRPTRSCGNICVLRPAIRPIFSEFTRPAIGNVPSIRRSSTR